ncbi:MAG: Gfo/Idh/MocA family oxidoreductase [Saprospiraceae bacterium]|nr:Gfo/Idh/MocA family oxidoreductase [Saprospiraceae bacterium]
MNWGIIGLGRIAHKFATDLKVLPNARLHAVASQSMERVQAFANQYNTPHVFGSYDEIVTCPDLDVVYIATPHVSHCENTLLCLRHKIPVLCEKPFAMNLREAQKMVMTAHENQTFLMEAIWTRFLPTTKKALELIENDAIGKVLSVKADFGFNALFDPQGRLFNQNLGGGSLLDIGIYPAFLALLVLGKPFRIKAFAKIGPTGVDEEMGAILQYEDGRLAHLHSTILAKTKTEAFIYGEKGIIHLHSRWHEPTTMTLLLNDERPQEFHFDFESKGYSYEAAHVMQCLQEGKAESELLPLDFSLQLMELLDNIRKEAGITYPQD